MRLREEQQSLIDAQRDADTTVYALKRILNMSDSQQIEFADQQDFFQTPSLDLSDPLATALLQRPELHSLGENIKAAEFAHKAAVAKSLPTLTFDGFWDEQGQTFNTANPGYQYQVNMSVPIFTGGRLRAERKSTALAEQRTQKQLAQERNLVTEQVRDGQVELQAALHQVELGRQEVQLANEEVSLSQGRFQSGVTDNIEVTASAGFARPRKRRGDRRAVSLQHRTCATRTRSWQCGADLYPSLINTISREDKAMSEAVLESTSRRIHRQHPSLQSQVGSPEGGRLC